MLETWSGIAGGSVVYMDTRTPQSGKVVARVPFANGIAAVNTSTIAVASSSKQGFYLFTRQDGDAEGEVLGLQLQRIVRTPAAVDNLSSDDGEGRVLLAGHPFAPAVARLARARGACDLHGSAEEKGKCVCDAPSWVAEWSEDKGLREVWRDDGSGFCSSSSFVRDGVRGVGIVSGLYESGVLRVEM